MNHTRENQSKPHQGKPDTNSVHKPPTPEQRLDDDYDVKPSIPTPQAKPGSPKAKTRNP